MRDKIEKLLFLYGFCPLLIVKDRCSKRGEYEMCGLIVEVIEAHNEKYKTELPTNYSFEAIIEMKIAFMFHFNLMGDIAHRNVEAYADEIEKKLNIGKWYRKK